jgi:hypothetical protein
MIKITTPKETVPMTIHRRITQPAIKNIAINLLIITCALILAANSFAGEKVGTVTHLIGALHVKKADGTSRVLSINSIVEEGDTLTTVEGTYGRIQFTDNSEMTLRPNTQIKISNYKYNEAKPQEDSAVFDLTKGGLRAVTGLVGKRGNPDSYKVNVPTGTIGIRGTAYDIAFCNNNCGKLPNGLYLSVIEGSVLLKNNTGIQTFNAGQYAYVKDNQSKPVLLPGKPALNFRLPSSVIPKKGDQGSKQGGGSSTGSITDVQKARITADIASKKPLRLILRESRAAGINVQDAVTAMLGAGANPAAVVNAAGAEGYQTDEAVSAVLAFVKDKGADSKVVQSVISAAIAVGVTQETISTIAADVGYNPSQIANAIVVAQTAPTAPVFGYSAPPPISTFSSPALALTTSTPTAIGGAPVAVAGAGAGGAGGGGHGTVVGVTGSPVSTPVASPVKPQQIR